MSTRLKNESVYVITLSGYDYTEVVAILTEKDVAEYLVELLKKVDSGYECDHFHVDDLSRVQKAIDAAREMRDAVNRFDAARESIGVPDAEERKGE